MGGGGARGEGWWWRRQDPPQGNNDAGRTLEGRFGTHSSYRKFNATKLVTLMRYLDMLNRKDEFAQPWEWNDVRMYRLLGSSTATLIIISALGLRPGNDTSLPPYSLLLSWWPSKTVQLDCCHDGRWLHQQELRLLSHLLPLGEKKDKQDKAVVLWVDLPGGSVMSSKAILKEIKLLDKVSIFLSCPHAQREEGLTRVSHLSFSTCLIINLDNSLSYVQY
jgi:hypothetical protein